MDGIWTNVERCQECPIYQNPSWVPQVYPYDSEDTIKILESFLMRGYVYNTHVWYKYK